MNKNSQKYDFIFVFIRIFNTKHTAIQVDITHLKN